MKVIKWVKLVERESDFWKNYMMISATGDIKTIFNCAIKERLTTRRGMTFIHWLNPRATWDCSLQIEEKIKANSKWIKKLSLVFSDAQKKLMKIDEQLEKLDFGKLTNKELLEFYNRFCDAYKGLYAPFHLALYIDSIEYKAKSWLLSELKKIKQEKKFDGYFIKLSAWPEPSLLQQEELSLIEIAVKIKKKNRNADKLLNKHTAKFAGLPVVNDQTKPWNKKYFQGELDKLLIKFQGELVEDSKKLHSYRSQVKKDQLVLFSKLSVPRLMQNFFQFIGLSVWVRLMSRNAFALSHYASRNLFKEIGRRNNLSAEDIKWLAPEETKNLILAGCLPPAKKLVDRKFATVLLFRNGKSLIFEGEKADEFIKKEVDKPLPIFKQEFIKGAVAYPGIAKGPVKLILSQKDISKMRPGDILVARMTTPEIVPAARLAAAIVTDEGGITCHAAIISRELKIPCIVGTKFATRMLTDNDLVEVDANRGVIKLSKQL